MVTRVVSLTPAPDPGDTLLLDGRPAVVLHLLPKLPGRRPAVRAAFDLPVQRLRYAPDLRCPLAPLVVSVLQVRDGLRPGSAGRPGP